MKKTLLLLISAIVWIIGLSIVVFNNSYQLSLTFISNRNAVISFLAVLIGVTTYAIINRKGLIKELK